MSLHPDYLMTHQVWPVEPGRSIVHCDWFFHPDTIGGARLRPVGRDRLLGPDQPPGLARLRAPAAGHRLPRLHPGPLLQPGGLGPRVRPDVRRPLRERRPVERPRGQGLAPPRRQGVRGLAERAARPRGDPRPRPRRARRPGRVPGRRPAPDPRSPDGRHPPPFRPPTPRVHPGGSRHGHRRSVRRRGLVVLDPLLRAVVPEVAVLREDARGRLLGLRHLQPPCTCRATTATRSRSTGRS